MIRFARNKGAMMKAKTEFEFKFEGSSHAIDINTLLVCQFNYYAILLELQKTFYPDSSLTIKIQSFEQGSFDVNQIIEITTAAASLFVPGKDIINILFTWFNQYLELRQFLKGQKPENVIPLAENQVSISIAGNNNTFICDSSILEMYKKDHSLDKAAEKCFNALSNDDNIEGVTITNKTLGKKVFTAQRETFKDFTAANPYFEKETQEKIIDNVVLKIKKLEISPTEKSKWDFVFNGRYIKSVAILDTDFLQEVKNGRRFGNGDSLTAQLKIIYKYNATDDAYMEHSFEVLKVSDITPQQNEPSLFT